MFILLIWLICYNYVFNWLNRGVGTAAETHNVSIHAILQNPILNHTELDFVVTTEQVALSSVQAFALEVSKMHFAKEYPIFMPII